MSLKHARGIARNAIRAARIARGDGDKKLLQRKAFLKVAEALHLECRIKGRDHQPRTVTLGCAL